MNPCLNFPQKVNIKSFNLVYQLIGINGKKLEIMITFAAC